MKLNYLGTRHWMVSSVGVDVGWFEKGEEVWERKHKGGRGEKKVKKKTICYASPSTFRQHLVNLLVECILLKNCVHAETSIEN